MADKRSDAWNERRAFVQAAEGRSGSSRRRFPAHLSRGAGRD